MTRAVESKLWDDRYYMREDVLETPDDTRIGDIA